MAFHVAGSMCFKEAMKKAEPVLLEPIMKEPPLRGRDLIENGAEASADFHEYLDYALKLKLAGEDRASQLKQTLAYIRKKTEGK